MASKQRVFLNKHVKSCRQGAVFDNGNTLLRHGRLALGKTRINQEQARARWEWAMEYDFVDENERLTIG